MERRSPLYSAYESAGARFTTHEGCLVPELFTSLSQECAAVRQAAGVVDWSARGFLTATGADQADFLHRMLSNEVKQLESGQGNYSTLLTAQGHLVADLNLWRMEDHVLLETHWTTKDILRETLERYVIADDVLLTDQSDALTALLVEGPAAASLLAAAGTQLLPGKEFNHTWVRFSDGTPVHVANLSQTGSRGYELIFVTEVAHNVWETLAAARRQIPWEPVGIAALNVLRTEAGIPWHGAELKATTLPPEAGLEARAISYTKGCYLGQEIIERIRSRGHVNRKLTGLVIDADAVPAAGTKLMVAGKEVGEITTAVHSPTFGRVIALGYVRCEHLTPKTRLEIGSGGTAEVTTLPFLRLP